MYLVGVCFGILTAFLFAENVCRWIVVDAVVIAVIWVVELLHTATAPTCMILRVLKCCLSLWGRRIKIRIFCADAIPMVTIQNSIVIRRRVVVAEFLASLVNTVDVPSLCVILSHGFTGIVGYPCRSIVIRQREKVGNAILSTYELQQGIASVGG